VVKPYNLAMSWDAVYQTKFPRRLGLKPHGIVLFLCLLVGTIFAGIPASLAEPAFLRSEAPLEVSAQNTWLWVPAQTQSLIMANGSQKDSIVLTDLYLQRSHLDIAIRPTTGQQLWMQVPIQYTYDLVGKVGYTSAWTLGDARAMWISRWDNWSAIKWKSMLGFILPTATTSNHVYLISELDALPEIRLIGDHQSPNGADLVRLVVGISPALTFPIGLARPMTWEFQTLFRQPLGSGDGKPFPLVDLEMAWRLPLEERIGVQATLAQTRGFRADGILDSDVPSATISQLSLYGSFTMGLSWQLGLRWNPLAESEKELYQVQMTSSRLAEVRWAVEPAFQILAGLSFAWNPDSDPHDLILAPNVDLDHDGITNKKDLCPEDPEDLDGFRDQDGCPEFDNDHDHVKDLHDLCPNEAEDIDGSSDQDGCPDLDNDHDGIPDLQDRCPNEAENKDGLHDEDGCPDRDSDHDGIEDSHDKCPKIKETFNFYQDKDGCPDEKPDRVSRSDLNGLRYEMDRYELDSNGVQIVHDLAEKMKLYPATNIELIGHTDGNESDPMTLGLNRANTIVMELKRLGIAEDRMKSVSRGSQKPIANNQTAKGRAKNRRVDLEPK
jgi:outer membrane protein OmpA-like peptidoglycan-associated protein